MRFYEDFHVGVAREVGSHEVTRDEIVDFARQWDPRPFHLDEEVAARSVFGSLSASSCHTYALTARITFESGDDVAAAANLKTELRFPSPVRPGDRVTLVSECVEKRLSRSHPGLGIVTGTSRLLNQDGVAVLVMETISMIRTRESPGEYAEEVD
jgi:acyl dehydratase